MEDWDVVVVGAGPAGSTAARFAAEGGARTLVLEKREVVGVPVQCGEFVPTPDTLEELMPRVEGVKELFDIPPRCVSRRVSGIVVVSPAGRRYEVDFQGLSLYRAKYDQHLANLAVEAGAELRTGERVTGVVPGGVATDEGRVRARVVIGADGPLSIVRRSAGLPPPAQLCPCLQYTVSGDFGDVLEMHLGSVAPGGYAWLIPKAEGANIGLGVPRTRSRRTLRSRLDDFVTKLGLAERPKLETSGLVPISGPPAETVRGSVLICGDAAGHVMASNGGGVPPALVCGRAAGEVAASFISSGRPLDDYERRWRAEVGELLSNSVHVRRLAGWWMWSDIAIELAMALLGERGVRRALTCKRLLGFY